MHPILFLFFKIVAMAIRITVAYSSYVAQSLTAYTGLHCCNYRLFYDITGRGSHPIFAGHRYPDNDHFPYPDTGLGPDSGPNQFRASGWSKILASSFSSSSFSKDPSGEGLMHAESDIGLLSIMDSGSGSSKSVVKIFGKSSSVVMGFNSSSLLPLFHPTPLQPREKLELWEKLKVMSFTRTASSLWSMIMLCLYVRVQVNIFGRHLYLEVARCPESSLLLDESDSFSRHGQQDFLATADYLSARGINTLITNMKEATMEVLKEKQLKDPFSMV